MTTDIRCVFSAALLGATVVVGGGVAGASEPPPAPPARVEAPHEVIQERDRSAPSLDTAIFTEISPVTAAEPALRLPEDQREGD